MMAMTLSPLVFTTSSWRFRRQQLERRWPWSSSFSLTIVALVFVVDLTSLVTVEGFQTAATTSKISMLSPFQRTESTRHHGRNPSSLTRSSIVLALSKYDDDPGYKRGYQFGDLTKGIIKQFGNSVNNLTGKEEYEFGDLTKWLDQKAKSDVKEFTNQETYHFGDISKEIVRRFLSGEYTKDDIILFLKIVTMIGIELQPISKILPIHILVEMLNVSIAQDIGGKALGVISSEVDSRMKQFVTGDRDYKIGDITKTKITGSKGESGYQFGDLTKHAINQFTGKDKYEFGDLTKKLLFGNKGGSNDENKQQQQQQQQSESGGGNDRRVDLSNEEMIIDILNDERIRKDLEEWDKKYILAEQQKQERDIK